MHKLNIKIFIFVFAIMFGIGNKTIYAGTEYYNPDTGFVVVMNDEADLLTDSEQGSLKEIMTEITQYGNVAITTISYNPYYSTEEYIRSFYMENFGTSSGTVFAIDMYYRNIWIYSDGEVYKNITTSYANTITDNVYTYASDEEYYVCCDAALEQILTLLEGGKIAQPMKYISNLLLAMIIAMLINYIIVIKTSRVKEPSHKEIADSIEMTFAFSDPYAAFKKETKRYSPQSSGSSGGGGGGRGGSSGGGGGHSF